MVAMLDPSDNVVLSEIIHSLDTDRERFVDPLPILVVFAHPFVMGRARDLHLATRSFDDRIL